MGITMIIVLVAGVALLAAMVIWNDWHPGWRRDVDLFDALDEPDTLYDREMRR
jgi:hypothetical protein